jgi:hypothetical protein
MPAGRGHLAAVPAMLAAMMCRIEALGARYALLIAAALACRR